MLSNIESENSQDVIAERYLDKDIDESNAVLLISKFSDRHVLSVYDINNNDLLAFRILSGNSEKDNWLKFPFLRKTEVDFDMDFELLPSVNDEERNAVNRIEIIYNSQPGHIHFCNAILKQHELSNTGNAAYIYNKNEKFAIILFKNKTCVLANSFECSTQQDLLYFVLNALEINEIRQEETILYQDYNMMIKFGSENNFRLYFREFNNMIMPDETPDEQVPYLAESLFANHFAFLCGL